MTAPIAKTIQMEYQNTMASKPLFMPIVVLANTPDDEIIRNITVNSARDLEWISAEPKHKGVAILVGGGSSIEDEISNIRKLRSNGGTLFAMNGAAKWCIDNFIDVDYQCILDAKEETKILVEPNANKHIFGSQVNPATMESVDNPIVWHCNTGDIEKYFPKERIERGGYALMIGGTACGNSAMSVVYALGFRELHIFGFDSCHKDGKSHAYNQPMNRFIPKTSVTWGDKTFTSSVAMKAQAEDFQLTSQVLKQLGVKFSVYGEGLLQSMYSTPVKNLSEQEKYQLMWQYDGYRQSSPGEAQVDFFLKEVKPDSLIIDYGCGTGRAGVKMVEKGHDVLLVDFADNCRDAEAADIFFLKWDLTYPIPHKSEYGYCTDVMEHIPPDDVETVIKNIMTASTTVFFQISNIDDHLGVMIGSPLHLTVKPIKWWSELFTSLGYKILFEYDNSKIASTFIITTEIQS